MMMFDLTQAPLDIHHETVRPEWIDYNGHMNVAYYTLVFDHAVDLFMDAIGVDESYRRTNGGSLFAVEQHICYLAELKAGDPLRVTTQLIAFDAKRVHYFHRLYQTADNYLAATAEAVSLHVDLAARRSRPFPPEIAARLDTMMTAHAALGRPPESGRAIGLGSPR